MGIREASLKDRVLRKMAPEELEKSERKAQVFWLLLKFLVVKNAENLENEKTGKRG